jgi:NAD(P)-dependent dehydrogenase (short-subunit alcohol dehydrogenase family)
MTMQFAGRVALVTGGGSGIGAACARHLTDRGARVLVADRDRAAAERVAADLGEGAAAFEADVRDPEQVRCMVDAAVERLGGLDVAINNAGVSRAGVPLHETTLADWELVRSVNYDGVFHCLQQEFRVMIAAGGGAVVNVSSVMGVVGTRGAVAYVAAKHGVIGMTKAAAVDGAEHGIRVNAVGPGFVDTPLLKPATRERMGAVVAEHLVGRLGTAEEIAAVVGFLASPAASFVTGAFYPVDGGYTAH